MGSTQIPGMTRADLVREAVKGFEIADRETGELTGESIRILQSADVADGVWTVACRFGADGNRIGPSFIALRLISSDLFFKDMDESCGPTLDTLPAALFNAVDALPADATGYARSFRGRVAERLGR